MHKSFATRLRALVLVAAVLFSLSFVAEAQAAGAVGASTPRAAVITEILAIRSGNLAKLCSVGNPKYLTDVAAAWGKTCVAKAKHYIAAYPKDWASYQKQARNTPLSLIEHAKVKISGDHATLSYSVTTKSKNGTSTTSTTYYLTRIAHRWLIDYSVGSETATLSS